MPWSGDVEGQVRNEFREAQRFARGIFPRVGDDEAAPVAPRAVVEPKDTSRRRIVTPRGTPS